MINRILDIIIKLIGYSVLILSAFFLLFLVFTITMMLYGVIVHGFPVY